MQFWFTYAQGNHLVRGESLSKPLSKVIQLPVVWDMSFAQIRRFLARLTDQNVKGVRSQSAVVAEGITSEIASIHSLLERPLPRLGSSTCKFSVPSKDVTENERASSATAFGRFAVIPLLLLHRRLHGGDLPAHVAYHYAELNQYTLNQKKI